MPGETPSTTVRVEDADTPVDGVCVGGTDRAQLTIDYSSIAPTVRLRPTGDEDLGNAIMDARVLELEPAAFPRPVRDDPTQRTTVQNDDPVIHEVMVAGRTDWAPIIIDYSKHTAAAEVRVYQSPACSFPTTTRTLPFETASPTTAHGD